MSLDAKRAAAAAALTQVREGMRLGLGTGSTAAEFVKLLGAEGFTGPCVATSEATAALARLVGLNVVSPEDMKGGVDLAVDGADELDDRLTLIKGGGGALLREKIVALSAKRFIVVADSSKRVAQIGRFPLPVEVAPFAWGWTAARIAEAAPWAGAPILRRSALGDPVITDGGGFLLDTPCRAIADPAALAQALQAIPGVIEHGLFVGLAHEAFVADPGGGVLHLT